MTAQYTDTRVRMNPMEYTQSRAFSEDFRMPVLVSGEDKVGQMMYHQTLEQIRKTVK